MLCLEAPLLGKAARMKRARSATKRNQELRQNQPNGKPMSGISRRSAHLLLTADTSSSDMGGDAIETEVRSTPLHFAVEPNESIQQPVQDTNR